ncbi:MAG: glycosyltransferase family 4 protein [Candidatus Bathyarchaeota archaeon]|nr:glycosyltransferase family 4 protein [Candidatus Bathyarchaeota archaeon]
MRLIFIFPYLTFEPRVSAYVANMLKRGHEVYIIAYSQYRRGWVHLDGANWFFVDAISLSFRGMVWKFPYFLHLEKLISQIKPDIIHINNLPFLTTLQAARTSKKMGVASIIHVHGVIGKWNKLMDLLQYAFLQLFAQRFFNDTKLVICLTQSDACEVQKFGCPKNKIRLIPNGVDVEVFKPAKETPDLLFWGGRFIQQKGLEYLIEALSIIKEKIPDVKLLLSGDGVLISKMHHMVKLAGLQKNVKFLGCVTLESIPILVNSCSVYVLPSLKEGMPYALLEAMACGKPVVGSDIPGIKDIIVNNQNGILVPPKNPQAIAHAVLLLLKDEKLRLKIGENARKTIFNDYQWNLIINKVEKVYSEALKI